MRIARGRANLPVWRRADLVARETRRVVAAPFLPTVSLRMHRPGPGYSIVWMKRACVEEVS